MSDGARGALGALATRGALGGVLMGLANLVPGISGGTMLLAAGVYTPFVQAVAEVTTLRFRFRSVLLLASVGAAAAASIVLLAGPVKFMVSTHRWVMYSLFIGLTLGGVPLVWRMARPATTVLATGAASGFAAMAVMVFARAASPDAGHWALLLVAGVAGASAMILPGVSGAYLLLVLGQYETILGAIDDCKRGLAGEPGLIVGALGVIVPVGIGVAVGVAGISNFIRWMLDHHPQAILGVLLGLLFGSVLGIWPFQQAAEPSSSVGYYTPSLAQAGAGLALVALGLAITLAIDRLGDGASGR